MNTAGVNDLTVEATAAISVSANAQAVRFTAATTDGVITNSGTIEDTAGAGRAIRIETGVGSSFTATFTNNAGGIIQSDDDAIQVQSAITSGTIGIENAGLIKSTVGQAIDFGAVNGATVTLTNTGAIQSGANDAIRTGANAEVVNSGTINGGTTAGFTASTDGVDFRAFSGSLHNLTGGDISADRHGVNAGDNDVAGTIIVINEAGAAITGRNGSGVGSDGGGGVTNYGTITGSFSNDIASDVNSAGAGGTPDGQADGDGDGVDFDFQATIINYGTIQGTGAGGHGSDGLANTSEGIAAGGGSITNHAGATISGAGIGILVDDSSQGNATFQTTIVNDGTIEGTALFGIKLVSALADTIENNGTITSGNGTAILFGSGDNTLTLGSGSSIDGQSDGGLGTNTLAYSGWTTRVIVNLASGYASGADGVANFQNVTGSGGADLLLGDAGANVLSGGGGNDRLYGDLGDTLNGDTGTDTITLYDAPADVDGGDGSDTLIVDGTITFAAGSIANVERIVVEDGALADFTLLADGLTLAARSSAGGGVEIIGTAGADRISARLGNDTLQGGAGDDLLIGGSGDDTFAYARAGFGKDTVTRFADGLDKVEISTTLAADFGALTIVDQGSRTVIDFGGGDMIVLRGVHATDVDASDFLFV
ncbi:calcium-binding protein [Oleomonas cavernae]|uniref:Calcium-binding protein n=2 Tax=Oleomonas cavernae TaxID=2320859 RepID=A0A418WAX7_9PROT|nr:calcium-binding protein [Oleomonas cavernae]